VDVGHEAAEVAVRALFMLRVVWQHSHLQGLVKAAGEGQFACEECKSEDAGSLHHQTSKRTLRPFTGSGAALYPAVVMRPSSTSLRRMAKATSLLC
jgi:hypothetical protein